MPRLRRLSGHEVIAILEKFGFEVGFRRRMRAMYGERASGYNVWEASSKDAEIGHFEWPSRIG